MGDPSDYTAGCAATGVQLTFDPTTATSTTSNTVVSAITPATVTAGIDTAITFTPTDSSTAPHASDTYEWVSTWADCSTVDDAAPDAWATVAQTGTSLSAGTLYLCWLSNGQSSGAIQA